MFVTNTANDSGGGTKRYLLIEEVNRDVERSNLPPQFRNARKTIGRAFLDGAGRASDEFLSRMTLADGQNFTGFLPEHRSVFQQTLIVIDTQNNNARYVVGHNLITMTRFGITVQRCDEGGCR